METSYCIEIPETDKSFLYQFNETQTDIQVERKIAAGELFLPPSIHPGHFLSSRIDSVFATYHRVTNGKAHFSKDLKFVFHLNTWEALEENFYLPWSCGYQFRYKELPILFLMSGAAMVMSLPMSVENKYIHLRSLLTNILQFTNVFFDYKHKAESLTLELAHRNQKYFPGVTSTKVDSDGGLISDVLFCRSSQDLDHLNHPEVLDVIRLLGKCAGVTRAERQNSASIEICLKSYPQDFRLRS